MAGSGPGGWAVDYSYESREDRLLSAARATFPEWDITEALGGVIAVPAGCPVHAAASVDALVGKLRAATAAEQDGG